ncbi:hypothetical protein Tco_0054986, partial [Tanacetum coccineum]
MEAKVEGYLVRRIHIDEGVSIKITYEHCFNMLHSSIQARLGETRTMVSGFSREQVKPLGKIELRCLLWGKWIVPAGDNEIHYHPDAFSIQHHFGPPGPKETQSHPIHHSRNDEVPNSIGNRDLGLLPAPGDRPQDRLSGGVSLKCFLDAYKGYHQVQMAEEDEEKTMFYTDQ